MSLIFTKENNETLTYGAIIKKRANTEDLVPVTLIGNYPVRLPGEEYRLWRSGEVFKVFECMSQIDATTNHMVMSSREPLNILSYHEKNDPVLIVSADNICFGRKAIDENIINAKKLREYIEIELPLQEKRDKRI